MCLTLCAPRPCKLNKCLYRFCKKCHRQSSVSRYSIPSISAKLQSPKLVNFTVVSFAILQLWHLLLFGWKIVRVRDELITIISKLKENYNKMRIQGMQRRTGSKGANFQVSCFRDGQEKNIHPILYLIAHALRNFISTTSEHHRSHGQSWQTKISQITNKNPAKINRTIHHIYIIYTNAQW